MKNYLYGASIQVIQSFIFKSNKLREIIGASALIERICTSDFNNIDGLNLNEENILQAAAGNLKFKLNEEQCKKMVLSFPKMVSEFAPGTTLVQAVVELKDGNLPLMEIESKLRIQRNKLEFNSGLSFMSLARDRKNGGAAVRIDESSDSNKLFLSQESFVKREMLNNREGLKLMQNMFHKISGIEHVKDQEMIFDLKDIVKSENNSWIAVVHIDGNGLGKIIQTKASELYSNNEFNIFSNSIQTATENALQFAFSQVILKEKGSYNSVYKYPIRPVIVGGDDVTLIIRADLAIDFVESFLREFEIQTTNLFSSKIKKTSQITGLTACAGIAFIKKSYPLHYGFHLAEELCKDAKSNSREHSSLAFYKVQDSFINNLDNIKLSTLMSDYGLSFYNGPYNFDKLSRINGYLEKLNGLKSEDNRTLIGKLRNIVSEMLIDKNSAIFMLERLKLINSNYYNELKDLIDNEIEQLKFEKYDSASGKVATSQLLDLINIYNLKYGND